MNLTSTTRFTPASAGNIVSTCSQHGLSRVHPRIRGEYSVFGLLQINTLGSPPHPRGILFLDTACHDLPRFTPASAGNMIEVSRTGDEFEVHPRIRGEYILRVIWRLLGGGSPPHPRGIYDSLFHIFQFLRFTPASAGNILNKSLFFLTFLLITLQISFNFL